MKQDLTDMTVILDRSGSMQSIKTDTEGGFNKFMDEQRKVPGQCLVTLTQFDTEFEIVYSGRPISDVPKLDLVPRGWTALLDAMGKTINEIGARLSKMAEDDRPGKIIVVVVTDGQENSSREFNKAQISEMVKRQTDVYKWTFIYLGANQDAIAEAKTMGIVGANSMTYAANAVGTRSAFADTSSNVAKLRTGKGDGSYSQGQRDSQTAAGAAQP